MEAKKKRRRRRKKRLSAGKKAGLFFLIFSGILLLVCMIALGAYFWMDNRGKNAFAKKQEALPEQMQSAADDRNLAEGGQSDGAEDADGENGMEESDRLKAGSLRYKGKTYAYKQDVLTFLFMGIDKKGEVKASSNLFKGGQSDALFLAVLDPQDKTIKIIGVNRDTMAKMDVFDKNGLYAGKETAQIALAHAYGDGLEESCENTVNAVSNLFYGLPIHGYCALNMSVISTINDAVGGVDVTIPESVAKFKKGWNVGDTVHLTGEDAYIYVHHRDTAVAQSAEARLERQKQYLNAFIRQAKAAMKQDMTLPFKLYTKITPYMVTDVTADQAVYLAGEALSYSFDKEDIYSMQGEVKEGEQFEEFYPDDTALYELILEVFYREV